MKINKRVLPALLVSLFAGLGATGAQAQAAQFSGFYAFGDSLSDAGYYRGFLAASGVPAALVTEMGRFTTNPGPVWSEIVSRYYGFNPAPSNVSGGNIFAQGGSRINSVPGVNIPPGQTSRPVSTQIDEYLARGAADPGALYSVWGGANDVFFNLAAFSAGAITQAQLQTNVLGAATAEIGQIARLKAAGARYVLVFGLPNIGGAPAFAGQPTASAVTALSAGYNTTLFTGLQGAGISVIPVDTFTLFTEVLANASAFGFTNTSGIACGAFPPVTTAATANSLFCHTSTLVAPNAQNTYAFADSVHPTTGSHRILGDFVKSLVEGPAAYGVLAESAMRSRESHIRSLADGIAMNRPAQEGTFSVFVAGDRTDFDIGSAGFAGMETRTSSGTVGVSMRASDSVVVGASYGGTKHQSTLGGNAGEYRVGENIWSLFASLRWGGFYATGIASLADVEYSNLRRNIALGNVTRVTDANTEGSNTSGYISAGYDFPIGRFTIGPTVSVTLQDIEVNSFDEAGGGSAGLRVLQQKRKSEVWSAGLLASYRFARWTPWVRVTADEERRDDAREVSAVPLSMLAINNTYSVPTYRPDSSWITASVGVSVALSPTMALSAGYYYMDGRNNVKQDSIAGMLSVRF